MLLSEDNLLSLVSKIYDAAGDASLWPAFLEEFSNAAGGTMTSLVYHDMTAPRATLAVSVRGDPECERQYLQYYSAFDPFRTAWLARFNRAGANGVVTSEQVIDPSDLQKTEFYNDLLVPNHIVHQFGGPITFNNHLSAVLTCLRTASQGPFGPDEVRLLCLLLPHLQRALEFRRRFAELETSQRSSLDALDHLPIGVILVDRRGRILVINRVGRQILNLNDGLTTDRDGLKAVMHHHTKQLRSIISTACDHQRDCLSAGGCLKVDRPSGKRPFSLVIMPASSRTVATEAGTPTGIIFVADPEAKTQVGPDVLKAIYNLTEAESRLAQQLAEGKTLIRAAEELGIGHNTARTHLQRIYRKTETCHQGDLVRLLLVGAGQIHQEPRG